MKTKFLALLILALTLCVGAIFLSGTASASAEDPKQVLSVDSAWIEGDTLYMDVTNTQTGVAQTLTVSLQGYASNADEYISIQAVDADGNTSNTVRFQNPYYQPTVAGSADVTPEPPAVATDTAPDPSSTAAPATTDNPAPADTPAPTNSGALTPDGTGTVMDNVTTVDGKQIYTVSTADGNVFYVVIDPARSSDNVYLLNAVTEDDLKSMAKPGDGTTTGAAAATPTPTPEPTPTPSPSPPATTTPVKSGGVGGGTVIFIVIAALAAGGAGYYFKILKPKRQAADVDDEYEDEPAPEPVSTQEEPDDYGDYYETEYDGEENR